MLSECLLVIVADKLEQTRLSTIDWFFALVSQLQGFTFDQHSCLNYAHIELAASSLYALSLQYSASQTVVSYAVKLLNYSKKT